MPPIALAVLLAAAPVEPGPPLALAAVPEKPARGRLVRVTADTPAKARLLWRVDGPAVDAGPGCDAKSFQFVTSGTGTVTVRAYAADESGIAEAVLKIEVEAPPEPPPPPLPGPDDGLVRRLQAGYDADPAPVDQRRADLRQLAALYAEASRLAANPQLTTAGQLLGALRDASAALVPTGRLTAVRQTIAADLAAELPTDPAAPLTPSVREAAATRFARIAAALGRVQP